jgi:acetyl-CoA C-acetyltransferase
VIDEARAMAGTDLEDIDVVETHDCFTISEYLAYEHLGLAEPGEAWKVVESGATGADGPLPVNPSGGLIGAGHPVGATGVRMLVDAAAQVGGTAGDTQIEGARTAQTLNIGGSLTTVASFIVQT